MYKIVAILGAYTFKVMMLGGGLLFYWYIIIKLRVSVFTAVLCTLIIYAPLTKRVPLEYGAGLNPRTFLIALLILLWMARPKNEPLQTPLKGLVLLWIGLHVLSFSMAAFSADPGYVREGLTQLKRFVDPLFVFFFVLNVREEHETRALVLSLVLATAMVGLHGYIQGITTGGRIPGMLEHPNLTMSFLSAYVPLLLVLALMKMPMRYRMALGIGVFVVLFAIVETRSRMGLLAAILACLLVLLLSGRKSPAILAIVVGGALLVAPELLPQKVYKRFQALKEGDVELNVDNPDANVASRFAIWRGGMKVIEQHPVVGCGFGRFKHEVAPHLMDYYGWARPRSAHNTYIKTAAEAGILALVVLLLLFLRIFQHALEVVRKHPDPFAKTLARGLIGTAAAVAFSNLTSSGFHDAEVMTGFWCLVGIVTVYRGTIDKALEQAKGAESVGA